MQKSTYTVLFRNNNIAGLNIVAGPINKVVITGNPLFMNSQADYIIEFRPYNEIPENGAIAIEFPAEYNGIIQD